MSIGVASANLKMKPIVFDAGSSRELSERHGLALPRHAYVLALIVALLHLGSPTTVAGLVVTVHVDAVERVAVGLRPHVNQERGEIVTPAVTHLNAASAIQRVGALARVGASFLGVTPRDVFSGEISAVSATVFGITGSPMLALDASATSRLAVPQVFGFCGSCAAAVASALPLSSSVRFGADALNNEHSEALSGEVVKVMGVHRKLYRGWLEMTLAFFVFLGVTVTSTIPNLGTVKLTDRQLMREVGLLARERIVRRTISGRDAKGGSFQPYSPAYAERKAKEGLGGGQVNLQVSGAMLNDLQITEVTDESVTLGWVK
jgi:hypothetical protein